MDSAEKRKEQGNKLIKEQDYENAALRYVQGIGYLEIVNDASTEEAEVVKALKLSLYSNLCLCYLKLNKHWRVIENGRMALELESNNVKVLFRRGIFGKARTKNTSVFFTLPSFL
jgi:hypothetical protein